jgi:hypothetical protein
MVPKRKNSDAAFSARPSRKKTSSLAEVNASYTPEALLVCTGRPIRNTRASVNYNLFDTEEIGDDIESPDKDPKRKIKRPKLKVKEYSDSGVLTDGDNDQSESFVTPSELDMSSGQFLSSNQFQSGAPDSED